MRIYRVDIAGLNAPWARGKDLSCVSGEATSAAAPGRGGEKVLAPEDLIDVDVLTEAEARVAVSSRSGGIEMPPIPPRVGPLARHISDLAQRGQKILVESSPCPPLFEVHDDILTLPRPRSWRHLKTLSAPDLRPSQRAMWHQMLADIRQDKFFSACEKYHCLFPFFSRGRCQATWMWVVGAVAYLETGASDRAHAMLSKKLREHTDRVPSLPVYLEAHVFALAARVRGVGDQAVTLLEDVLDDIAWRLMQPLSRRGRQSP